MESKIVFKPWVGKAYENSKTKVLILGESHYCGDDTMLDGVTNKVMETLIGYYCSVNPFEPWMRTFTKFANVFSGRQLTKVEQRQFWQSFIFYNYVQKPTKGPRIAPSFDDFQFSYKALLEVIDAHNPDKIILWGNRLWNNLPKRDIYDDSGLMVLRRNGRNILLKVVYHPSSTRFSYSLTKEIQEFIH